MLVTGDEVAVGQGAERAVRGRQHRVGHPFDPVVALPPRDEVGDGEHRQPFTRGEGDDSRHPGHRAVVLDELADDADRREAGEPA